MDLKYPKVYNQSFQSPKKEFPKIIKYLILVCLLLAGLVYGLFYSPLFKIKNIDVNSPQPEVRSIFTALIGQNILKFPAATIANQIKQNYPEIKNVKISRGLPDTVIVKTEERQPKLMWQTGERNFLVDQNGEVYAESSAGIGSLPLIKDNSEVKVDIGQKILSDKFINFINELNANFNAKTNLNLVRFEINETTFQVEVATDTKLKFLFDTTRSAAPQLDDLAKFLGEHKNEVTEYADVRVEGKVYYK